MTHSEHGGPTLTPVTHSDKAVAIGAVSFYVDRFVTGRINTEKQMERERVRAGKRMEGPVGQEDRWILELENQSQRKDLRIAELEFHVRNVSSDYDS